MAATAQEKEEGRAALENQKFERHLRRGVSRSHCVKPPGGDGNGVGRRSGVGRDRKQEDGG